MVRLGLGAMGLLAIVDGACGGGASNPNGAHPGDFITADVDGVSVRAAFEPSAGTSGVDAGELWIVAGKDSMLDGWKVYLPNHVGTTTCPTSWIGLYKLEAPIVCSEGPGAGCSVTVTTVAPALGDVVEGTFTATLSPYGADPSTAQVNVVTNGAFHVTRNFQ